VLVYFRWVLDWKSSFLLIAHSALICFLSFCALVLRLRFPCTKFFELGGCSVLSDRLPFCIPSYFTDCSYSPALRYPVPQGPSPPVCAEDIFCLVNKPQSVCRALTLIDNPGRPVCITDVTVIRAGWYRQFPKIFLAHEQPS
jgi:hypothetical protein